MEDVNTYPLTLRWCNVNHQTRPEEWLCPVCASDELDRYREWKQGYQPRWCAISVCSGMGGELVDPEGWPVWMCKRHAEHFREVIEDAHKYKELCK